MLNRNAQLARKNPAQVGRGLAGLAEKELQPFEVFRQLDGVGNAHRVGHRRKLIDFVTREILLVTTRLGGQCDRAEVLKLGVLVQRHPVLGVRAGTHNAQGADLLCLISCHNVKI